jgi:hypothetical protein
MVWKFSTSELVSRKRCFNGETPVDPGGDQMKLFVALVFFLILFMMTDRTLAMATLIAILIFSFIRLMGVRENKKK